MINTERPWAHSDTITEGPLDSLQVWSRDLEVFWP